MPKTPVDELVHTMIHELNRKGKAAGAGFYEYPENGKKHLWDGLSRWTKANDISEQDMIDRFLFVQALDTLRCYEEGVLESVIDANVGSIFGIGFAPWTGGAIQFLNQNGIEKSLQRSEQLAAQYGERFNPPQLLKDKVQKKEIIQ